MSSPYVTEVGSIRDIDDQRLTVGVDYDSVTVGRYRLNREQCEEFGRAFIAACWEAADNARLMAEEASSG